MSFHHLGNKKKGFEKPFFTLKFSSLLQDADAKTELIAKGRQTRRPPKAQHRSACNLSPVPACARRGCKMCFLKRRKNRRILFKV